MADLFRSDKRVIVVGDIMLDSYARGEVNRISPEAPVPVLRHLEQLEVAGGGANVAVNLAKLGGSVDLISVIGSDAEGVRLADIVKSEGVKAHLLECHDRPTTTKVRVMSGGQQLLRWDKESVAPLNMADEDRLLSKVAEVIDGSAIIILSDYAKGCLTDRVINETISLAKTVSVPVLVDPKRPNFCIYKGAQYLTPNRNELRVATGIPSVNDVECLAAASVAYEQTGAAILLTRSEHGMTLYREGQEVHSLPAEVREVFDVSGAGDTVIATFALALVSGYADKQAMQLANAAAGIAVSRMGTAPVSHQDLKTYLNSQATAHDDEGVIEDWRYLVGLRQRWQAKGLSVGFTNGCFDLVHPGHVKILTEAASHCDRLIVALNTDASVKRLKGESRPIQTQDARAIVVSALKPVDVVTFFDQQTPLELIEALKPDVLIKGADYTEEQIVGASVVKAAGGKVIRVGISDGHSTSNLVKKSQTSPVENNVTA